MFHKKCIKVHEIIFSGGKSLCISEKSTRPIEEFLDEKVIVIQPAIKNATVVYSVVFYEELRKFPIKSKTKLENLF